jgi:hypothetical protein
MKKHGDKPTDELRLEYDMRQLLKGAVRGKYAKRFHAGTNFVRLERDARKAALWLPQNIRHLQRQLTRIKIRPVAQNHHSQFVTRESIDNRSESHRAP